MKLYNFNELLSVAKARDFKAIGSFNLHCLEMLPAFFKAAKATHSPLMIQISTGTAEYLATGCWLIPCARWRQAKTYPPVCTWITARTSPRSKRRLMPVSVR